MNNWCFIHGNVLRKADKVHICYWLTKVKQIYESVCCSMVSTTYILVGKSRRKIAEEDEIEIQIELAYGLPYFI